jgi:hypothetical protein
VALEYSDRLDGPWQTDPAAVVVEGASYSAKPSLSSAAKARFFRFKWSTGNL